MHAWRTKLALLETIVLLAISCSFTSTRQARGPALFAHRHRSRWRKQSGGRCVFVPVLP